MAASLFAGPVENDKGKGRARTEDEERQFHFQQLKAVCVPLLNTTRHTPSPTTTAMLLTSLAALRAAVLAVPPHLFSASLANYVFFPLSSLLQPATPHRSDAVLESVLRALAELVTRWRASPGKGMEDRVLHEFWIMTVLRLGGPLDSKGPKKIGKLDDQMMEESKDAAVAVLIALMEPVKVVSAPQLTADDDDPLGDKIDWTADDPFSIPAPSSEAPAALPPPPPLPILFHTLTTLLNLASMPTSHPKLQLASLAALKLLIVHYLAPRASGIDGPSPLLATALPGTISTLTRIAVSLPSSSQAPDQARRQPAQAVAASLDLLSIVLVSALADSVTVALRPAITSLDALALVSSEQGELPPATQPPTGPTLPTAAWLTHTLNSLTTILTPLLSSLPSHTSPSVLVSLSSFCDAFLTASPSLPSTITTHLLAALLQLSSSSWPTVATASRTSLVRLLPAHARTATSLIHSLLNSLPRAIRRSDPSVTSTTAILCSALSLLPSDARPLFHSDRWALALVKALPFTSHVDISIPNVSEGVGELCEALGTWAGRVERAQELVRIFVGINEPGSWWILEGIVRGLGSDEGGGKEARKAIRDVVGRVVQELEADNAREPREDLAEEAEALELVSEGAVTVIEHRQGLTPLPLMSALRPVSVSRNQRASFDPILLRVLAASSSSLGSSFRPLLLKSIYPLLQPTPAARSALEIVAHATGYASATNLLRANADYALNSIARRLGAARLDPTAPAVLGELVRVGGSDVVGLMGDVVDDVWDALDDYHGYEQVALGLWSVLEAVVGQIEEDVVAPPKVPKMSQGEEDWQRFVAWYEVVKRADFDDATTHDDLPDVNPQVPFASASGKSDDPLDSDAGEDKDASGFPESADLEGPPPSPSQALAVQILSKATYYLSHSSPILRARVLRLMSSSVALFAPSNDPGRHGHYLPAVHRAWPFVLPRLAPTEDAAVVRAALGLIATLATHCGEFMGRRIVDDAWPRMKMLLELPWTSAIQGRYAEHHRLTGALLETLERIAVGVPLKEEALWDMADVCRRFLVPGEEQTVALRLYRALAEANEDAIWVAVKGTVDAGEGKGDMRWLALDGEQQVPRKVLDCLFH